MSQPPVPRSMLWLATLIPAQAGCAEEVDARPWRVLRAMASMELNTIELLWSERVEALDFVLPMPTDDQRANAWQSCAYRTEYMRILGKHTDMLCQVLGDMTIPDDARCMEYHGPRLDRDPCGGPAPRSDMPFNLEPGHERALETWLAARRDFLRRL